MTEIERLNAELQAVCAKIREIIRWWDAEAPVTDALIREVRAYLEGTENE